MGDAQRYEMIMGLLAGNLDADELRGIARYAVARCAATLNGPYGVRAAVGTAVQEEVTE